MIHDLYLDSAFFKLGYNLKRILTFLIINMATGPNILTLNYYHWHHFFSLKEKKQSYCFQTRMRHEHLPTLAILIGT